MEMKDFESLPTYFTYLERFWACLINSLLQSANEKVLIKPIYFWIILWNF